MIRGYSCHVNPDYSNVFSSTEQSVNHADYLTKSLDYAMIIVHMNEQTNAIKKTELRRELTVSDVKEAPVLSAVEQERSQVAISQIEAAIDLVQQRIHQAQFERSALTKALSFIKDKLLRRESADQTLRKQLTELQNLQRTVETHPSQAEAAIEFVKQQHGTELLISQEVSSDEVEVRAKQLLDTAAQSGKPMEMDEAVRLVQNNLATEEDIMRDWFAAGDAMQAHGEAENTAKEAAQSSYQERFQAAQAIDAKKNAQSARVWEERLESELDLNDELVRDATLKSSDGKMVFRAKELSEEAKMIRSWFDAGTYRDIAMQRAMAESKTASELYQKEIARGAKSVKAQTMAFELFLSGRMALKKFTSTLEKIRKDLGPGLLVDHAIRAGAEHQLACMRITEQLKKTMPELRGYSSSSVDVYRVTDTQERSLAIITPDQKVIYLNSNEVDQAGIFEDELEKVTAVSVEELTEFMPTLSGKQKAS